MRGINSTYSFSCQQVNQFMTNRWADLLIVLREGIWFDDQTGDPLRIRKHWTDISVFLVLNGAACILLLGLYEYDVVIKYKQTSV